MNSKSQLRRSLGVLAAVVGGFGLIGAQLIRLGLQARPEVRTAIAEPIGRSFSRPDIVDRNGRLLATDIEAHSLYADPALIQDADEAAEKLAELFPDLDAIELRRQLSDAARRFVWIKRGLSPGRARLVHELGLPGIGFRKELRRVYPLGRLAGHMIGSVNVDNKGLSGLERAIDDAGDVEAVSGPGRSAKPAWQASIDTGVQHAVEDELAAAITRYGASAAAGIVMDATTGEIVASASLPGVDPGRAAEASDPARLDRIQGGSYELGSIFKALTIAQSLDSGLATIDTAFDVREPLRAGPFTIKDLHPQGRPLTVREIFLHSSNVGAGMIALGAGAERQKDFLAKLGLTQPLRLETGPVAQPQIPQRWDRTEAITISYGHGLAVAPVQFAAAMATLVNGGTKVTPSFRAQIGGRRNGEMLQLLSPTTSARMRELMRLNVTHTSGTGRRADVDGYRVGGKTGTAEMPGAGGYQKKAVIASFAAAFPMDAPRYVVLVMLFQPQGQDETRGQITAGLNAAPVTGRIVERVAPVVGVLPRRIGEPRTVFDATGNAQ